MDLFWLSCSAAGVSLACVAGLVLAGGRRRVVQWRTLAAASPDVQESGRGTPAMALLAEPFSAALWGWLRPWLRVLGRGMMPFLSWRRRAAVARQVQGAGFGAAWDLAAVVGLFVLAGVGGGALAAAFVLLLNDSAQHLAISLAAALPAGGVAVVWLVWRHIRGLAERRRSTMLREFPFLLDLMTLCVEAGQNLHAALLQAAHFGPLGPLRQELRVALAAMRAGHSRQQALDALALRCDLTAVALWVAAVQQADRLGMSLAPLLRAQAAQQRSDRFLRAETLAMQAPVRMLFPLVTCMFPCSFLVIGFPIANLLLQSLQ